MKTLANISLDEPGIVLFDPRTLTEYLRARREEGHAGRGATRHFT